MEERQEFGLKRGQQAIWTVYHQLPASIAPLVENQDILGGQVTDHQVSFTVKEYGYAIGTSEALDLLSYHGPISNIVRTLLAPNQALTMDTICRNMFWYATNRAILDNTQVGPAFKYYTGGAASRGALSPINSLMTADVARASAYHLTVRRVPTMGGQQPSYVAITHPSVTYDLRTDPYWKDAQLYAGATRIFNGEEGMIHGMRFIKSDRARIPNGGALTAQQAINANVNAGGNSVAVTTITGFAVGQEVSIHNTGVSTTTSAGTWTAPDGQDPTDEEVIIKTITGSGPYTITFTNKLIQNHLSGDFITAALDVYPIIFLGGLPPMGKGTVVPPEIRVSLPVDKLRRLSYIGWYNLGGFGVVRDWAYEVVETLASVNTPPPFGY